MERLKFFNVSYRGLFFFFFYLGVSFILPTHDFRHTVVLMEAVRSQVMGIVLDIGQRFKEQAEKSRQADFANVLEVNGMYCAVSRFLSSLPSLDLFSLSGSKLTKNNIMYTAVDI